MEFTLKLVTVFTVVSLSTAQLNYNNPIYIPEYIQTQSSFVEAVQQPPTNQELETANFNIQQLPKADAPRPFYTAEPQPSTVLKAPTEDAVITNFNTQNYPPVPSPELQLPSLVRWNPNDDPNLYYPVVVDKVVPVNLPTAVYPKKYNKNVDKEKSTGLKLKALVDDAVNQKDLEKTLYNLAKLDNKNSLKQEKLVEVPNTFNQKVNDPVPAESGFGGFSPSLSSSSSSHDSNSLGFTHGAFSHGLGGHGGERIEFHVQGHDGPKSYKWGYDTGKGHNRHFRYEEKDKHGYVKGHYGYYDKHGKLRMIHYDSDPHEGFHASEGDIGSN